MIKFFEFLHFIEELQAGFLVPLLKPGFKRLVKIREIEIASEDGGHKRKKERKRERKSERKKRKEAYGAQIVIFRKC